MKIAKQCRLCGTVSEQAIEVLAATICIACEHRLVMVEPGHPEYADIVEQVKRLWPSPVTTEIR